MLKVKLDDLEYNFLKTAKDVKLYDKIFSFANSVYMYKIENFSEKGMKTKFEVILSEGEFEYNLKIYKELGDYNLFYNDLNGETFINYLEKKLETFDFEKFVYYIYEKVLYLDGYSLENLISDDLDNSKKLNSRFNRYKILENLFNEYEEKE